MNTPAPPAHSLSVTRSTAAIRLLYVTDALAMGGDTRTEYLLISGLDKKRFSVVVMTSSSGASAWQFAAIEDIEYHAVNFGTVADWSLPGRRKLRRKAASGLHLANSLRAVAYRAWRSKPDIIFTGDRTRAMVAAQAAHRVCGGTLVFHPQFFLDKSFANYRLKRATALRADLVIGNSGYTNGTYAAAGVAADRLLLAHNGIDTHQFSPSADTHDRRGQFGIPPDKVVIGICSVLRPFKGHDILLQALPEIVEAVPRAHLVIAGEDRLDGALQQLTTKLGMQAHVTFIGFQPDTLPIFHMLDLYVMPSVAEPFGLVTVEAMACEKAVVGTASGGTPEIIVDGETGLLVAPGQPKLLAEAIIILLRDPARRQAMGRKGRERVLARFSTEERCARISSALTGLSPRRG